MERLAEPLSRRSHGLVPRGNQGGTSGDGEREHDLKF